MRSDRERLLDIREAIMRIERHAAQDQTALGENELVQTWVVHHLQIIGEACRALSDDFRRQHSDIPWSQIIGMRNILVHHYFGVDVPVVWSVIQRDLPDLKTKVAAILQQLPDSSP
jgi:uncharacterized protein with HEPN domain